MTIIPLSSLTWQDLIQHHYNNVDHRYDVVWNQLQRGMLMRLSPHSGQRFIHTGLTVADDTACILPVCRFYWHTQHSRFWVLSP